MAVSPQTFYYVALAGFLVTLGLLFHFIEKFREAGLPDVIPEPLPADGPSAPEIELKKTEDVIKTINSEISGFKGRIGELRSMVDNRRSLHENQINAIIEHINTLVGRLEHIPPSEVDKVQPEIQALLEELETLRLPAAHNAESESPRK
jgi:hypothetical protein